MKKLGYSVFRRVPTAHLLLKMSLLSVTLPFLVCATTSLVVATDKENANAPYYLPVRSFRYLRYSIRVRLSIILSMYSDSAMPWAVSFPHPTRTFVLNG